MIGTVIWHSRQVASLFKTKPQIQSHYRQILTGPPCLLVGCRPTGGHHQFRSGDCLVLACAFVFLSCAAVAMCMCDRVRVVVSCV